MFIYHLFNHCYIIILTRKHIQIHIISLFYEVSNDVTCADQLNKSIACLVTFSKMLTPWIAKGYHINTLDESFGECNNMRLAPDGLGPAKTGIQYKMFAPTLHTYATGYSNPTTSAAP